MSGEFDVIDQFFRPLAASSEALGLQDDGAVIPAGLEFAISTDTLVEGVHFLSGYTPQQVAARALRSNLSDLAAMAAHPAYYTLNLTLPSWVDDGWLEGFASELKRHQHDFGWQLLGGDTTSGSQLVITVTAFGKLAGKTPRRSNAKIGDSIYVSGFVGDSGVGVQTFLNPAEYENWTSDQRAYFQQRHFYPKPRIDLASELGKIRCAVADVSDGLLADVRQICKSSDVAAEIDALRIPISGSYADLVGASVEARLKAACSGEDYELVVCASSRDVQASPLLRESLIEIGQISGQGLSVTCHAAGKAVQLPDSLGWAHF